MLLICFRAYYWSVQNIFSFIIGCSTFIMLLINFFGSISKINPSMSITNSFTAFGMNLNLFKTILLLRYLYCLITNFVKQTGQGVLELRLLLKDNVMRKSVIEKVETNGFVLNNQKITENSVFQIDNLKLKDSCIFNMELAKILFQKNLLEPSYSLLIKQGQFLNQAPSKSLYHVLLQEMTYKYSMQIIEQGNYNEAYSLLNKALSIIGYKPDLSFVKADIELKLDNKKQSLKTKNKAVPLQKNQNKKYKSINYYYRKSQK